MISKVMARAGTLASLSLVLSAPFGPGEAVAHPLPVGVEIHSGDQGRYVLKAGETHEGDLYLFKAGAQIDGTLVGDLYVFAQRLDLSGTVRGDLNAWVQDADLDGTIEDSVRVFCQSLRVTGTIDGSLVAFCGSVEIEEGAVVTGGVKARAARVDVRGAVREDLDAKGGQVVVSGSIGGDALLEADIIEIRDRARIGGDLFYTSRNRLDLADKGIVRGDIEYTPEKPKPPVSKKGFASWLLGLLVALVTGLAVIAIAPRRTVDVAEKVGGDGLRSAGVGFITTIVIPVALAIVCVLIITIPLVVMALLVFLMVVYLAKVPVAIWAGDRVLRRLGRSAASPYLSLTVGIPLLYVVFAVPFLGEVAWWATMFVGLGALVMCSWESRQRRAAGGAGAAPPTAPPGSAPGLPPGSGSAT